MHQNKRKVNQVDKECRFQQHLLTVDFDEEKLVDGAFEPQLDQLDQLLDGFEIDERLIICIARFGIFCVKRGFVDDMA